MTRRFREKGSTTPFQAIVHWSDVSNGAQHGGDGGDDEEGGDGPVRVRAETSGAIV